MLRTGRLLHPASHPASRPRTGAFLPGTLASPRAGLPPAGCRELVARLRGPPPTFSLAPELLDARRVHLFRSVASPAVFPITARLPEVGHGVGVARQCSRAGVSPDERSRSPSWPGIGAGRANSKKRPGHGPDPKLVTAPIRGFCVLQVA